MKWDIVALEPLALSILNDFLKMPFQNLKIMMMMTTNKDKLYGFSNMYDSICINYNF